MEKREGRCLAFKKRDGISEKDRERWSLEIQREVRSQPWYCQADIVLSYVSFRSEVSTGKINRWILEDGKQLFLPRTYADRHVMEFYRVSDLTMLTGGYQGIQEPAETEPFSAAGKTAFLDGKHILMIMPGVAFDKEGKRIGYGGGYYDRYLSVCGDWIENTVMLAFAEQEIPVFECEPCDRKPDRIIVQDGLRFRMED